MSKPAAAALASLLLCGAGPAPQEPAAVTPEPLTMAALQQQWIAIEERLCVESYRRYGHRIMDLDEEVAAFLKEYAHGLVISPATGPAAELSARGRRLLEAGCDDPLVKLATAALTPPAQRTNADLDLLLDAVDGLRRSGYPRLRLAQASVQAFGRLLDIDQRDAAGAARLSADSYVQCAADHVFTADEQRYFFHVLEPPILNRLPLSASRLLCEGLANSAGLDPWLVHLCRGVGRMREAWAARGSGFANTVSEEGWRGFAAHMTAAAEHLLAAHELHPQRPEAAALLVEVAMAGYARGDAPRVWFDRAVAAQFDWMDAYSNHLRALMPRWGGSHEALREFGLECAATGRFDTAVPYQLFIAMLTMAEDGDEGVAAWRAAGLYEAVAGVMDSYLARPEPAAPRSYATASAVAAYHTGRMSEAAAALGRIGDDPVDDILARARVPRDRLLDDVALHRAGVAALVTRADDALVRGEPDVAARVLREALEQCGEGPRCGQLLRHRLAGADLLQRLAGGGWVGLEFPAGLPGWRARRGAWVARRDGGLRAGVTEEGALLVSGCEPGRRLELEVVIDFGSMADRRSSRMGIVLNCKDVGQRSSWHSVTLAPSEGRLLVRNRNREDNPIEVRLPGSRRPVERVTLNVQQWDEEVVVRVDGTVMYRGPLPAADSQELGGGIGFCGDGETYNGFAVFRDARLRRLLEPPA